MSESTTIPSLEARSGDAADRRRDVHNLHFTLNQAVKNTYSVWLLGTFIAASTWRDQVQWLPWIWVFTVGIAFTTRNRLLAAGRNLAILEADPEHWRRLFNVSTLVCGAVATSGALLLFPPISDTARMYISMIYCGWLAGAMSSLGARPRLYTAYGIVFVSGLAAAWFVVSSEYRYEVLLMLLLFVAITSGFSRSFAAQVNESIEIRYANEQLVESLRSASAAAEESSAAKSRFLAVASHDLRQPLHAVTLLNGLLARPQTAERIAEISRQMGRALATLERLFNSVLDFSKIDTDKVKPEMGWYDLPRLFSVLHTSYASQATEKGVRLTFVDLNVAVRTDIDLLERILRNLIDNALKFTEQGAVTVEALWLEQSLVIRVSDTGRGIAPNLHEEVFKEYYQVGAGTKTSGLGLGLAIVRRLSDLLGLRVELHDAIPQGCQFDIYVAAAMVRSPADASHEDQGGERTPVLSGYFVAYVDDDASSRDAMALLLDDWGCRFVMAHTLSELTKRLADGDAPDAILTDFSLENGVTGLDVIQSIRNRFGPVSAAILTGDVSAIELEKLGELEYPVLRKPVPAKELKGLLEVFKNIA